MTSLPFESDWIVVVPTKPPSRSTREVHELLFTHRTSPGISVVRIRFEMSLRKVTVEMLASGIVVFTDSVLARNIENFVTQPECLDAMKALSALQLDVGNLVRGLMNVYLVDAFIHPFIRTCVRERYWAVLAREWAEAK